MILTVLAIVALGVGVAQSTADLSGVDPLYGMYLGPHLPVRRKVSRRFPPRRPMFQENRPHL